MKVVIVAVGRFAFVKGAEEAVLRWTTAGDTVALVSFRPLEAEGWPVGPVVALGQPRTLARFGTLGRAVGRIWPGSPARQLARKVRRSAEARALLQDADLVCGVEATTAQALYRSSRRNPDAAHVIGLEAALAWSQR